MAGLKNLTFVFAITGEMYKLLSGPSSNARFHIQIQDTDYTKQRSIDTMTPNKLTVYFVADMVVADMRRVALSCAPVRALLRTHGLESTLMQRCAHGSASVGALPWAQPRCAPLID